MVDLPGHHQYYFRMRYGLLVILALGLALIQHSWLSSWPLAPDLPLALLAWVVVDGTDKGVLIRAWIVGLMRDLVDPGSIYFHTAAYLLLAIAFLPARQLVFRTRAAGWAGFAAIASVLVAQIDRVISGGGDGGILGQMATAMLTAVATFPLGWTLGFLPAPIHPAGKAGA